MQLSLRQLMPLPLADRLATRPSGVWMQSVDLEPGSSVFVQAPSGTGKTTLIHSLYGLRHDYSGSIGWDSLRLNEAGREQVASLRSTALSVVFQDMRLFPELTLAENLEIKRSLTDTVSKERMQEWIARLGIAHKSDSPAATLSYGEQQRTAIVRALLQPFAWLLMDEPFSHLDLENKQRAAALIAEVVAERRAGFLLADLDANTYFPYQKTLML